MPDLLFLAQRLPYPPAKGEKIRAFHELKYLARWYDIHLGCLIDDPDDLQHVDVLRAMCRDVYVAQVKRRVGRISCLRGLLTGEALSVAYFRDQGLGEWVRRVAARVRPAVTFVSSSNMAPYVLEVRRTGTLVVDMVDIDSEKWLALAAATTIPRRLVYKREWRKIAELERRIAGEAERCVFASDAEAGLFASRHADCASRIRGVSNGVDQHYFDPAVYHPPVYDVARANYVFTGTMDYPPNVDAALWFATDILPLIRRRLPTAQFHVVGSNPNAAVLRLARLEGVWVTGRVPDVRPYIAHATAGVAPMRIARGIQNKVLEAMAMARPVVLTSAALEGIAAKPVTEVVVADTAPAFAEACWRMATGREGWAIGAAARAVVARDHDWDATLSRFDDLLRPARSREMAESV